MNRLMYCAPVLLAVIALSASGATNPQAAKELAKFQGAWDMQSLDQGGKSTPADEAKSLRLVLKGDHWEMQEAGKKIGAGTFAINPQTKSIDRTDSEGKDAGKKFHGIYEISGDTLRTCWGPAGKDRPATFETKKGDGRELDVLKRSKDQPTASHHSRGIHLASQAKSAG
jgi:uncharacterized protein (TIGR03067 family)